MEVRINWVRTNPNSSQDEGSYYISTEGRFTISPRFRSTVYPDSYALWDKTMGNTWNYDGIRDCKARAAYICKQEIAEKVSS